MSIINVVKDFTDAPGGGLIEQGPFSGEEFYLTLLEPKFRKLKYNERLEVNLDGGYGYSLNFIDQSFIRLVRDYGIYKVITQLVFISKEDPELLDTIYNLIITTITTTQKNIDSEYVDIVNDNFWELI